MTPKTLHERVATRMAASASVGPYASYETILAALKRKFPTEEDLRQIIAVMEQAARTADPELPPDWRFPVD